jgi:hypothetical protein
MALEDLFREALGELLANEYTLVRKDAHEQSLCGRLAIYLDRLKDKYGYEPYYVDVEYNRRGEGIKEIRHPITGEYIDVTCDILLHCRGERDDDNLIAVEMKKDYASDERKQRDRQRLQALTLPMPEGGSPDYVCGYQLGYYLEVHIGDATLLIEKYRSGQMTQSGTMEFARPERSRSDSDLFARRESRARKPARRKS